MADQLHVHPTSQSTNTTSSTIKPKLDTLPNEILQIIWPLSDNHNLPLASSKLYRSLNNEHVQRIFYRKRAEKCLREMIIGATRFTWWGPRGKPVDDLIKYMEEEHITPKFLNEVLERSQITNAELLHIAKTVPGAWGNASYHDGRFVPCVRLLVLSGARFPKRLVCGDVQVLLEEHTIR